jgi:glycosyltransferase involved in cell wall biosynthesis
MRALIAQMHVEDVVEAPGYADARVLADLLAKASIGVQTSLAEGLSMAVLEQMMAGIALVATDVGDTRQAVLHEKTGLLIPPKDEPALVECLRRLITNERLRAALGQAAREHALANFSLRAMSRRALEAYRQALGSR